MKFIFHIEAEKEFEEAIEYYKDIDLKLGYDFIVEIYKTIKLIMKYPFSWPIIKGEIRRALIKRFPYGILYIPYNETIYILAIMHLNKRPYYWKDRDLKPLS
jgi:hypothetical protein